MISAILRFFQDKDAGYTKADLDSCVDKLKSAREPGTIIALTAGEFNALRHIQVIRPNEPFFAPEPLYTYLWVK